MGVTFHHGTVVGMRCTDELGGGRGRGGASEPFRQVQSVLVSSPASSPASFPAASQSASGEILEIGAGRVVNAAGAFAADVLALAGESLAPLPVRARKRCIFNFHAAAAEAPLPPQQSPLVVDTTGVYFRPEGGGGTTSQASHPRRRGTPTARVSIPSLMWTTRFGRSRSDLVPPHHLTPPPPPPLEPPSPLPSSGLGVAHLTPHETKTHTT